MTQVWLVRHGEASASWGEHSDPGLSDKGLREAEASATHLQSVVPQDVALVSSPKARAQETAAPLAACLNRTVVVNDAFQEIQAPVPLESRQVWLQGFMRQTWDQQDESLWRWRDGIVSALQELTEPTVIFTHFLVINTVVAHSRQASKTVQCWPDNGSIHALELREGAIEVVRLGRQMTSVVN
ncbi:MAG: phosphoglycerate mutase family protein [Luminiphilus sp.]|jgi:probable phosphoglycerate mutase|nr:histidine phosphatase family protein [Halieaceae bacterium]MDG1493721.1 phosphoglycerate mutase family protein [Luminiphilus sp.]MDG1829533.1 phosphoglycerate mutase family protein [Luminiphilus sp.]MDG2136576.1 phosphoglycerate mutase family protein [Luminiphilus sp.]